jgi:magnesium transporter
MRKFEITAQPVELSALFPLNTVGREMLVGIPVFREGLRIEQIRKHVLNNANDYESLNYIFIVDSEHRLKGVISIKELLQEDSQKDSGKVMTANPVFANPMDPLPKVALLALNHNLKMIPVVDHKHRLVGVFTSHQLRDLVNKNFGNELLKLSGVRVNPKHFHFEQLKVVWGRLPWMLVGMIGGLVTGSIIGVYTESIRAVVLLAVFIPVIMSTGATSSNQSAMVFIRNLIHGDIKNWLQYLWNEIKTAVILGVLLGGILFGLLSFYPGDRVLAGAVSLSLFFTILGGAFVGVLTPMLLNKFKVDPSVGAGPFLTIIKDIIAMTIYFAVATAFLSAFT